MEILSWVFILILPLVLTLRYLVVQRVFFILRLLGVFWVPWVILIRLVLKLGIPPLHLWIIRIARRLSKESLAFLLTIHKVYPLFVLTKIVLRAQGAITVIVSLRISSLLIRDIGIVFITILYSSAINSIWILVRAAFSIRLVSFYWLVYRGMLSLILASLIFKDAKQMSFNQRILRRRIWLVLRGFPPFVLFWIKLYVVLSSIAIFGFILTSALVLTRVLILRAYYRSWFFRRFVLSLGKKTLSFARLGFISCLGIL